MAQPENPMAEYNNIPGYEEARQYWGELCKNGKPTDKLDRLFRGIASCISKEIEPHDGNDLLPHQLAAFYTHVGGDYDEFFKKPPANVAFIYTSLGCLHSLQPDPKEDIYSPPSLPALKPEGFIRWQTIQLLLGPHEHVPFLQNALREFKVIDATDGTPFPVILPAEAFPSTPDRNVEEWHDGIAQRLRQEAQDARRQMEEAHRQYPTRRHQQAISPQRSFEEQRTDAAKHFSNPLYVRDGRPTIVRRFSKATPRIVKEGGKVVAATVRQMASPHLWTKRRSSQDGRHDRSDELVKYEGRTTPTRSPRRSLSHRRPRSRSPESPDSSDMLFPRASRSHLRQLRSHSPPASPRETRKSWDSRRSSAEQPPPPNQEEESFGAEWGPSRSPPFAARVAQNQSHYTDSRHPSYDYRSDNMNSQGRPGAIPDRFRDQLPPEAYYRRGSAPAIPTNDLPARGRSGTDTRAQRPQQYGKPVNGNSARRYPDTSPWRR